MKKIAGMIHFETGGSPWARGWRNAEVCRELGLRWFESALRSCDNADRRERSSAMRWMEQTASVLPEMAEEMEGIAAGLGVEWEDYVLASFAGRLRVAAVDCSTFGAWTPEGRAVVGKTDDILPGQRGMNVLQSVRPDKGHAHVKIHFGGTVGVSSGMNSEGLVVALTGIPGPEVEGLGIPNLWLADLLLRVCGTVAEAIEAARRTPLSFYGCSLLLADRGDGMALIEKNALATKVLPPMEGGFFAHTNHILDPELEAASPRQSEELHANSHARQRLLRDLLPSAVPASVPNFERLLSQRNEHAAVWQTGDDVLHTDYAIIASPAEVGFRLFTACPGTAAPEDILVPE